jgi:superfamily I DNA/RNA helicase
MDKITLAMGADFLTSFAKLPKNIQSKVRQFITDFKSNPKSSSIHFEPITDFKDKKLRSVRIDQAYRGIILDTSSQNTFILLWVDHHDDAYRWAKNKVYSINPETGVIQFLDSDTIIGQPAVQSDIGKEAYLFDHIRDREFKRIGIPEILVPYIRLIKDQQDLDKKSEKLSPEVAETLVFLSAGFSLEEIERESLEQLNMQAQVDTDDFKTALEKDANKRSFTIVTEDSYLQEILDYPLDKWRVFLHPNQRNIISKKYSGPVRILGGAGTGKTVVALHRARFMAAGLTDREPSKRVLFTTFSKNLAENIRENLKKICTVNELKKIEVKNLDAWAAEYLQKNGFKTQIASADQCHSMWMKVQGRITFQHPLSFYQWEWDKVVQQKGLTSLGEYLKIKRIGSGTALNRKDRAEIWKVFQEYRTELELNNVCEYDDVIRNAGTLLKQDKSIHAYQYVVVDEAQDFSENAFNLISQIASNGGEPGPNSLFIVGDSQQRIYGRKVVLKHCGIKIQGRSRILKLNYRTTEEIGGFASNILSGEEFDDLDGEALSTLPYKSLIHGEDPFIISASDFQDELNRIKEHIELLGSNTDTDSAICIVLRTNKLLEKYRTGLEAIGIKTSEISISEKKADGPVSISTMHKVKGLEFDHVILAGASDKNIPNNYMLTVAPTSIEKRELEQGERSLLYVALTRARKSVAISWYGNPSEMVL